MAGPRYAPRPTPRPVSRRDLPHIARTLDAFYRILESLTQGITRPELPVLVAPTNWRPAPLPSRLPLEPVVENWSPPDWWVAYSLATNKLCDPDETPLDPRTPPSLWQLAWGISELLLAQLMPTGVYQEEDRHDGIDDIADSDLDVAQKRALVKIRHKLAPMFSFRENIAPAGSRVTFMELLEDALNVIGDDFGTARVTSAVKEPVPPIQVNASTAVKELIDAVDKAGLIGMEAKVVKLIAEKGGKVRVADAETQCECDAVSAFKRARPKMKKRGWKLYQRDKQLCADPLP